MAHKPGDIIYIKLSTHEDLKLEVLEVSPDDGRVTKAKVLSHLHEDLGKLGFFKEGDDWITFEYSIITPN